MKGPRSFARWVTHGMPPLPDDPAAAGWRVETQDCPTCGEPVTDMRTDRELEPVYPVRHMWPGGPPVTATWEAPVGQIVTSSVTALGCGHVWPAGETLTIRYYPPSRWKRWRRR